MACAGLGIIIWNEGKAVHTARALEQGHRDLVIPETTDVVFEEVRLRGIFLLQKTRINHFTFFRTIIN